MSETKELATINSEINSIMSGEVGNVVCTIVAKPGDRDAAGKIYNAMNNPQHRVSEFINQKIAIRDVLMEGLELVNEETGELERVPRIVLIDDKGEAYQAVSKGIYNSLRNLVKAFGAPTWEPALVVTVKQQPTKSGSMLTLVY